MKKENSLLEVILVVIIGILISYSFYLLIDYQVRRINSLERDTMKIQEEVVQLKAKILFLENNKQ